MNIQGNQGIYELLYQLLGTAAHVQQLAEGQVLIDPRRAKGALESLRQRMSSDIDAIGAYLHKL